MAEVKTETKHTLILDQSELDKLYGILTIVESNTEWNRDLREFANTLLWDKFNGIGAVAS